MISLNTLKSLTIIRSFSKQQIEDYYHQYSNSVLWPMCHYFFLHVKYEVSAWKAYKEIEQFVCTIGCVALKRMIWYGYTINHLMLLPEMIRTERENYGIGYFMQYSFSFV